MWILICALPRQVNLKVKIVILNCVDNHNQIWYYIQREINRKIKVEWINIAYLLNLGGIKNLSWYLWDEKSKNYCFKTLPKFYIFSRVKSFATFLKCMGEWWKILIDWRWIFTKISDSHFTYSFDLYTANDVFWYTDIEIYFNVWFF